MNKYNKITILVCVFFTALSITACGQIKKDEIINIEDFAANHQDSNMQSGESTDSEIQENEIVSAEKSSVSQQESTVQTVENTDAETKEDAAINTKESFENQQENSIQSIENADPERTAEELLDLFINGAISAVDSTDSTATFYTTDLNISSGEWDSFSIGEKVDLDNDGENELIICGPYGGIYLDARDNKVYKFAEGDGTALVLSYTYYNGDIWIMYSNRSSAGFEFYQMEKFEGADNLTAEMNFGEEFDINNAEAGVKYTLNGTEISYNEYTTLCSKIFAAEVSTSDGQIKNNDELDKKKQTDGTYAAEIGIHRVTGLKGTAVWEGDTLRFTSEVPYMLADISVTGSQAEVTFLTGGILGIQTGDVYSFPDGAPDE